MAKHEHAHHNEAAEAQQKILMYQILQQQLEELRRQIAVVETRIAEIDMAKEAMEEISKQKESSDILIPMGNGFYMKGTASGKNILADIGAGIIVEKPAKDSLKMLMEKRKEFEKRKEEIERDFNNTAKTINEMIPEIQKLSETLQK